MENLEVFDGRLELSNNESVSSSNSFRGSENASANDSTFYEKMLLEDMDSYWDDLNARFSVSRIVSDSVIKGMVQEASEKLVSKDAEIAALRERLHVWELAAARDNYCGLSLVGAEADGSPSEIQPGCLNLYPQRRPIDCISGLKIASKEQLQGLKHEIDNLQSLGTGDAHVGSVFEQCNVPESLKKMNVSLDALIIILEAVYEQIGGTIFGYKDSVCQQQCEAHVEKEGDKTVEHFISGLLEEFDTKFCEERHLNEKQRKNWLKKIDELSSLQKDLDTISNSLFGSESAHLVFQGSHGKFEELNNRKDNFSRKILGNHTPLYLSETEENGTIAAKDSTEAITETADINSLLSHMGTHELISFYTTEMTKMKRHHESALHDKTEELFAVKRELLREKSLSPLKKEREFEALRKKVLEFTSRLNGILQQNERFPITLDDHDSFCHLKDHINNLLIENQCLRGTLAEKRKELKCLLSRISDAETLISRHSSIEMKFLEQIKKLRPDFEDVKIEDVKIEAILQGEIINAVLVDQIGSVKGYIEDLVMDTTIDRDIYAIVLRESLRDARSSAHTMMLKCDDEEKFFRADLSRKNEALCLEAEKVAKLKDNVKLLSTLMKEKEKNSKDADSMLLQQKERFDLLCQELNQQKERFEVACLELNLLRQQKSEQERVISRYEKEVDTLEERLDDANNRVYNCEVEMSKLDEKLKCTISDLKNVEKQRIVLHDRVCQYEVEMSNLDEKLKEAEKQNMMLHEIIQEEQNSRSSANAERELHRAEMKSLVFSMLELSKAFDKFESKTTERILRSISRLENLKYQSYPVTQEADSLRKEILWYKKNLEVKSSNLQKAEIEVDLLGDEVDTLLSVLAKMYIALDHYSPVLQHYPGVMEILKLVRRELEGTFKPV